MKRNYHTNMAFLDLLFNTLLCFAALFCLAFILINPSKKNKTVEAKADFMITIILPADMDDDVDTYVEDPEGNLVAFNRREQGLMHLDRDDVGFSSDRIQTSFGVVEYKENREIVSLRGIVPGEYVVNVHMYTKREDKETPVTILLEKINPFKLVTARNVVLVQQGDEKVIGGPLCFKNLMMEGYDHKLIRKFLSENGVNADDYMEGVYIEDQPHD